MLPGILIKKKLQNNMKYFFCYFFVSITFIFYLNAQNGPFVFNGEIEFERKVNLYTLYKENPALLEILRMANRQFRTDEFILTFDSLQTYYKPGKLKPENELLPAIPADKNTVLTNFVTNTILTTKYFFDKKYLVKDSLLKVKWKLTGEKRNIAGLECKRANAIILDSLYIVVFFSEEIICRGGPESFSGLPGMILGVAIPQMHITWFAKRVSAKPAYKEPFNSENSNTLSFNEYKKQLFSECKNYGEIAK